ncbi:hypothetical protein GOODEAATRI_007732 [Goodea atripinnis]|uniref:Uncharacterized protein n=1 Tax=Goodea atripinnis TaxID=208336 RepID=A0ABV0PLY9_9TELE
MGFSSKSFEDIAADIAVACDPFHPHFFLPPNFQLIFLLASLSMIIWLTLLVKTKMKDTKPNNADEPKVRIKAKCASLTPTQCHRLADLLQMSYFTLMFV